MQEINFYNKAHIIGMLLILLLIFINIILKLFSKTNLLQYIDYYRDCYTEQIISNVLFVENKLI